MSKPLLNQIERNIAEDNIMKDIRNVFREKSTMTLKITSQRYKISVQDRWRKLLPTGRISNAFDDNFIENESDGDKDKALSIEEYLDKIRPYLSDI